MIENKENGSRKESMLQFALVALLTVFAEWFYFGFQNVDFSLPLSMQVDGLTVVIGVKNTLTGGNALIGWPFFQDMSVYSPWTAALYLLFVKTCGLFVKNPNTVFDLYVYAIPLVNVLVCYCVLRHFNIRAWLAYPSSLCFGFCPYVQWRLIGHYGFAAIECVPIVFMLCIWCLEDPAFERPGKRWFRYKRNWLALFFTWMIANNGMVYYPFFSCFVFLVTVLCLFMRERRLKAVTAPCLLIAQVAGWLAIGFIPTVVGMLNGAGNVAANGAVRGVGSAIPFMMRLDSLLLSPKGFGVGKIRGIIGTFSYVASVNGSYNENSCAYMGIVAIIGFLMLLVYLFIGRNNSGESDKLCGRLCLLSKATAAIIILAVSTGIGVLVNIVIPYIRCYNRISPFLVFCGVFAVALCAEALFEKYRVKKEVVCALAVVLTGVFIYGLWEQQGCYEYITEAKIEEQRQGYDADQVFVDQIEQTVGEDAMIFQLPYMRSFENGMTGNIPDYDHYRGLLHSDTLRWSYGAQSGTENDLWYRSVSCLQPQQMVDMLYEQGFSGIWLNLNGYEAAAGAALEEELCAAARCDEPILCDDGHTVFIPLSQELVYTTELSTGEIRAIRYEAEEDIVRVIVEELTGDTASVRYLEETLEENGTDGRTYTISLPEDGAYQLHRKTPEEKGEMRSVKTVAEGHDITLISDGNYLGTDIPFEIKEDTLYKVEVVFEQDTVFPASNALYVDFYGGPGYDRGEQDASGFAINGKDSYTFYFDSGAMDGESLDGYVRVFSTDLSASLQLDTLRVTEMERVG